MFLLNICVKKQTKMYSYVWKLPFIKCMYKYSSNVNECSILLNIMKYGDSKY